MKKFTTIAIISLSLATAFIASPAFAQTSAAIQTTAPVSGQKITLSNALALASSQGPDLASAIATWRNSQADLATKKADPSSLIQALSNAENSAELEQARVAAKRLEVQQNVLTAYFNLLEGQENLEWQQAQLALDERNLEIQKAKLASKNATALDVSKAESTVASSRQTVADAKAQLPVLSNKLEPLLGLPSASSLQADGALAMNIQNISLKDLENGLEKRVTSVLQSVQQVESNQLSVQLADNDYTAPTTLRDAKTNLENSQRSLETSKKNALTNIRDGYRSSLNSLEQVKIKQKDLDNSSESLSQDQSRFKSGQISRYQLQQSEVSLKRAEYSALQAINNYYKSLASLSVQAALNVTGIK
jgi:outer membrane protein